MFSPTLLNFLIENIEENKIILNSKKSILIEISKYFRSYAFLNELAYKVVANAYFIGDNYFTILFVCQNICKETHSY